MRNYFSIAFPSFEIDSSQVFHSINHGAKIVVRMIFKLSVVDWKGRRRGRHGGSNRQGRLQNQPEIFIHEAHSKFRPIVVCQGLFKVSNMRGRDHGSF